MDHTIAGEEIQTLQFILQPGHKLTVDMSSLCWCSTSVVLRPRITSFERLLGTNVMISDAMNETTSPAILGLNQIRGGKVLVVDVQKPLFCLKQQYICSSDVDIVSKSPPGKSFLLDKTYYCTAASTSASTVTVTGSGSRMFLQSGGIIFTKILGMEESLQIKASCMVAFEEDCKVTRIFPILNLFSSGDKDVFVKIEGPGTVYFCAHNISREAEELKVLLNMKTSWGSSLQSFFVQSTVFILVFMLLTLVIRVLAVSFATNVLMPFLEQFFAENKPFVDDMMEKLKNMGVNVHVNMENMPDMAEL